MPRLIVTTRNGERKVIDVGIDRSLMELIRDAGIDEIQAVCGGCCSCCTCHVHIDPDRLKDLPPISEQEQDLLGISPALGANSRLACQVQMTDALDGLRVTIAPED